MTTTPRIQKWIFAICKIESAADRQKISEAIGDPGANTNFPFRQSLAYALITVYYESPARFMLFVLCVIFLLPFFVLLQLFI